MRIESKLPKKQYLKEIKGRMGSFLEIHGKRFTGIFLGNLFWVTYHSGWEWNRRITDEKNRAYGFVRNDHGTTVVHYFCTRGYLDPIAMLFWFALLFGMCWLVVWLMSLGRGEPYLTEIWLPVSLFASIIYTLLFAVETHIKHGLTERGCFGKVMLMALLRHPEDPENNLQSYE